MGLHHDLVCEQRRPPTLAGEGSLSALGRPSSSGSARPTIVSQEMVGSPSVADTPGRHAPSRAKAVAPVALLVALVRHHQAYSVTLGHTTRATQSPRQMRRFLRWRVPERD